MFTWMAFLCLTWFSTLDTPQELYEKAKNFLDQRQNREALHYYNEAIGSVVSEEDLHIAVQAVKDLRKVYRRLRTDSPYPVKDVNTIDYSSQSQWGDHPYFQSLLTCNILLKQAREMPEYREQFLLTAFHMKIDYPPVIKAILEYGKENNRADVAAWCYTRYYKLVPLDIKKLDLANFELRLYEPEPLAPDSDAARLYKQGEGETLVNRLGEHATAVDYYYAAMAGYRKRRMFIDRDKRFLQRASALAPGQLSIEFQLAKASVENEYKAPRPCLPYLQANLDRFEKHPELLFQAARMAGTGEKKTYYRRLIETHPNFCQGYQGLRWFKKKEAFELLGQVLREQQLDENGLKTVWTYFDDKHKTEIAYPLVDAAFQVFPNQKHYAAILYHNRPKNDLRLDIRDAYSRLLWRDYLAALKDLRLMDAKNHLAAMAPLSEDLDVSLLNFYFKAMLDPTEIDKVDISTLVDNFPKTSCFREFKGDFLFYNDKMTQAIKAYEKAMELAPERESIYEKIEKCKDRRRTKIFSFIATSFAPPIGIPIGGGLWFRIDVHTLSSPRRGLEGARSVATRMASLGMPVEQIQALAMPLNSDNRYLDIFDHLTGTVNDLGLTFSSP